MKHLWLLLLPLFCLPDLLFSQQTPLGVLKWTDYVILPYIASVLLAGGLRPSSATRPITAAVLLFCLWAFVSTFTISLRYDYASDYPVRIGLAKLAKFALYAFAGISTLRLVSSSPDAEGRLRWSLLAALLISGVSMYISFTWLNELPETPDEPGFQFEAVNAVSVMMSMLMAFVLGEWAGGTTQVAWRNVGVVVLATAVAGFFLTGGRGGWIGLLVALAYILVRAGLRPSFVVGGLVLLAGATVLYTQNESFSHHVDITVNPSLLAEETEFARATGFDDGNRVDIFFHESQRLVNSPIFGTGLFHRGLRSGLYTTGSHNFFLQMFLETGLVGGAAIVLLFRRMWVLSAGTPLGAKRQLGTQAALVAAIAGGCTGEYFYGGPLLLMLLVLVAPALRQRLPASDPLPVPSVNQAGARLGLQPHA